MKKLALREIKAAHVEAEAYRQAQGTNRFPEKFKELVRMALEQGIAASKIGKVTGLHVNTLRAWLQAEERPLYSLEVIEACPGQTTIIFPSGAKVEVPLSWIEQRLAKWLGEVA